MIYTARLNKILISLLIVFIVACHSQDVPEKDKLVVTVEELRNTPDKFNGKYIIVAGEWYQEFERRSLYSSSSDKEMSIHINVDSQPCSSHWKYLIFELISKNKIRRQVNERERKGTNDLWYISANVELEGYFDYTNTDKKYKDVEGNEFMIFGSGYGHFGACKYQLRLCKMNFYEFTD